MKQSPMNHKSQGSLEAWNGDYKMAAGLEAKSRKGCGADRSKNGVEPRILGRISWQA
jgi:hypothetical protein